MFKQTLSSLALLIPALSYGQISFTMTNAKSGLQTGKKQIVYQGGVFSLLHTDGSLFIDPDCVGNGGSSPIPTGDIFCQTGTTGFLAAGDLNGDGLPDPPAWYAFTRAPIETAFTAPFSSEGIYVDLAPFSKLERPVISPVVDGSLTLLYNALSSPLQYTVARYYHERTFSAGSAGREDHDLTIVPGQYQFSVPSLSNPIARQPIGFALSSMPESYPGLTQASLPSGFHFDNDDHWHDGAMEMDPRLFLTINWSGITLGQEFFANSDFMQIWVLETPSASPFEVPTVGQTGVLFPPSGDPAVVTTTNLLNKRYTLPPSFFTIGETARLYMRMTRDRSSVGSPGEESIRVWMADLSFVDTYEGFALTITGFPPGTPSEQKEPGFDFDGDGSSNFIEFAFGTDPADPASNPSFAVVPFINGMGQCEVTITKRPNVGGSLKYEIEYSDDLLNWTKVTPGNPDWTIVTDDATELTVHSNAPSPGPCFVRAVLTAN